MRRVELCCRFQNVVEYHHDMSVIASWKNPGEATPLMTIDGIRKSFARGLARASHRTMALQDVYVEAFANDIVVIVGDEGAGKTTLLQCAAGLIRPDEGWIHGDQRIAYVPAVPVFYPFLTLRDVLSFRLRRTEASTSNALIDDVLLVTGLAGRGDEIVARLSTASMKRLAIAEAIVADPAVVLIDTSPSDAISARVLAETAKRGAAVFVGTRNCSAIAHVATKIACLVEGRLERIFLVNHPPELDGSVATLHRPVAPAFVAERMH
jgi:ABC-type multidrug transport system ATPase subunit